MDDSGFYRKAARRPATRMSDPVLQWASGLQTKDRRIYAGWLIEAGKQDWVDDAMDYVGFSQVTIKHGNGNLVTHWAIETADVFVVADGIQSIAEMDRTTDRYGIAFGWQERAGSPGQIQSVLRCRVFLRPMLEASFFDPFLMTVKGTLTGDLLKALFRQYEVLDAINVIRQEDRKPALDLPFYACSMPLGPGPEVTRGSGSQSKEIVTIVADIPAPITREYITRHWCKREWIPVIESLVDETIRWSIDSSRIIGRGVSETVETEEHEG